METKTLRKPETLKDGKPLDDKTRDRGDNKKADISKTKMNVKNTVRKHTLSDRGDVTTNKGNTQKIVTNPAKTDKKPIDKARKTDVKHKLIADVPKVNTEADKSTKIETNASVKSKIGEKKSVSDKSSVKAKVLNIVNVNKDAKVPMKTELKSVDRAKIETTLKEGSGEVVPESNRSDKLKVESDSSKKEKDAPFQRKATIKTVKSKNDKVYKAVTFTEQKRVKPTVLEINMPNIQAKKTKVKLVDKNLETQAPNTQLHNNKSTSKLGVKERTQINRRNRLTERSKRKKLNRCISSPDKFKKIESPPTEVAKWAPSSVSAHTKPYYEAWVNTTLAAITKVSKKDKLFLEKENIIKAFQKSLERAASPELVHEDYSNELYTGKIKIKHKNLTKGKRQPLITPLLDKDLMKI